MIALVARLVGSKLAPFLVWGLAVALLIGALWWLRSDAYRDGVRATDAKWEEASRRLEEQAREAAGKADSAAERRAEDFGNRIAEERERVEEAEQQGANPLDAIFGANRL